MTGYYSDRLSAERLRQCYEIAPRRVRQYLDAEIRYVADRVQPSDAVLELGCGYGRVMKDLAGETRMLVGIDTSYASLQLAREHLAGRSDCRLLLMDAIAMGFGNRVFEVVACVQNGISAFQVDQRALVAEAIRVTRPGGRVLFSSYSDKFWDDRLEWFRLQSEHGLVGEIDWEATGDGVIVCRDGFKATTIGRDDFVSLMSTFDIQWRIREVDESSLFCEMAV
jgi:2-polyprenyl-6-hydroxyphenyl methylase/3-demethylubiquinone-9 3-methyltransferase